MEGSMRVHQPTIVSTDDFDRLQALMCTLIGASTPLASMLRHKLESAVVMLPGDIGPDVAAPGRRVHFTIDGYRTEERTLSWDPPAKREDKVLSLMSVRGLSLLGLRAGQSVSYVTSTRRPELIELALVDGGPEPEAGLSSAGKAMALTPDLAPA
jgi:hypothetical protein